MDSTRDFRRPGYLLGGSSFGVAEPSQRKFFPLDDHTPYSDRKLADRDDAFLDEETIVAIQRMACAGKRTHEILEAFADQGVTMDQIMRLLDPPDEQADTRRAHRQSRATVGFAAFKGRK